MRDFAAHIAPHMQRIPRLVSYLREMTFVFRNAVVSAEMDEAMNKIVYGEREAAKKKAGGVLFVESSPTLANIRAKEYETGCADCDVAEFGNYAEEAKKGIIPYEVLKATNAAEIKEYFFKKGMPAPVSRAKLTEQIEYINKSLKKGIVFTPETGADKLCTLLFDALHGTSI